MLYDIIYVRPTTGKTIQKGGGRGPGDGGWKDQRPCMMEAVHHDQGGSYITAC